MSPDEIKLASVKFFKYPHKDFHEMMLQLRTTTFGYSHIFKNVRVGIILILLKIQFPKTVQITIFINRFYFFIRQQCERCFGFSKRIQHLTLVTK